MISVIICTYNRVDSLKETLESLKGISVSDDIQWELLIVDNNSKHNTREVVEDFIRTSGLNCRYVFEGQQGLSHARNRALEVAKDEIVSFIDDDVKVDSGWLEAVAIAFKKYSATIVGGKSYLIFPGKRPEWLSLKLDPVLSRLDYGDDVIVDTDKELFGLNFSVVRRDALKIGGFDPNLGRCGKSLNSGEEWDLQNRIRSNGGIAVYDPKAIVGHIVAPNRLTKKWFLKREYSGAASIERLLLMNSARLNVWINIYYAYKSLGSLIRSVIIKDCNSQELFLKYLSVSRKLGIIVEDIKYSIKLLRK